MTEAIEHALAAQDYEFAAALIGPQSQEWMRRGEVATILQKMKQLPDEIVRKSAGLCIWYGWVYSLGDFPPNWPIYGQTALRRSFHLIYKPS